MLLLNETLSQKHDTEFMLETFLLQATNHSVFTHIRRVKNKILFQTLPPAFSLCHHLSHISSCLFLFFFFSPQPSLTNTNIKGVVTWEWRSVDPAHGHRGSEPGENQTPGICHLTSPLQVTPPPVYEWGKKTHLVGILVQIRQKQNIFPTA